MKKAKVAIAIFALLGILLSLLSFVSLAKAEDVSGQTTKVFTDVSQDHPDMKAVYYLENAGVIGGYDDGSYKPASTINRAEFLKIVMGLSGYEIKGGDCFKDVKSEWYAPYICTANANGLIEGYKDGTFRPGQEINFVEASKIASKVLKLGLDESLSDNWYHKYVDALEMKNSIPATVLSLDKKFTRGEMADLVYRIVSDNSFELTNTYDGVVKGEVAEPTLKNFNSCSALKNYLKNNTRIYYPYYDVRMVEDAMPGSAEVAPSTASGTVGAEGEAQSLDFSGTNIQVAGVDEADVVKNDGKYIYTVKGQTVRIIDAYPASSMKEVSRIEASDSAEFYPSEMFVDGDTLVVIGDSYDYVNYFIKKAEKQNYGSLTEVVIYDIKDRANPVLVRKLAFEGFYNTSRKIGDDLYLVYEKSPGYRAAWDEAKDSDLLPWYADSGENSYGVVGGCESARYVPGADFDSYLNVVGISLSDKSRPISSEVILGGSGNVYASTGNLYVADQSYNPVLWRWDVSRWAEETNIYKFSLNDGAVAYSGFGKVNGRTLNQFSMDENDGYLRVATTEGRSWDSYAPSTNNVYVLDGDLNVAGKLFGLAKGEEIYSTRFMGDRAYMVTFKKVDPLFVIDLSDPKAPKVLGELKVPGYSDYLHPYDENHLIGFGFEAVGDGAWYQGLKIAMFDVTDVANPVEMHKVTVGDRGTYSDLSWNHKALLFDKEKGIFAFPVTIAEISDEVKNDPATPVWTYGESVFQGAYIYNVSLDKGFELKGKVSHFNDYQKEFKDNWEYGKEIKRILYIGNNFYTVSGAKVMANGMSDLVKNGEVVLGD